MPLDPVPGTPVGWMARARSSLALAKVTKPDDCLWEDLCFHAQQAAEKAIKAVLFCQGIPFRFVHDLNELLANIQTSGIAIPDRLREAGILNEFSVMTRYPGPYEQVTEDDYRRAVELAGIIVDWAESIIAASNRPPLSRDG
jgi:HEPN domain-containing protein